MTAVFEFVCLIGMMGPTITAHMPDDRQWARIAVERLLAEEMQAIDKLLDNGEL